MKPIWYFVGLVLVVIGGLILLSGIYYLLTGSVHPTVLANLHPEIWWSGVMLIVGIVFLILSRNMIVK